MISAMATGRDPRGSGWWSRDAFSTRPLATPSFTEIDVPDEEPPHALRFGGYRFVVHSRELTADGAPVALGNRALDVLNVLVEARGDLVTKDELLSRVWPTTTVEENNLQFQISSLRKALGDDRDLVRTVSGRGYRFVGEVTVEGRRAAVEGRATGVEARAESIIDHGRAPALPNLPAPTSAIVGREPHLNDVAALVEANRLVTLVGAGGIGKTRMAIELALRLSPAFEDGVWIVELAGLSDPALVLPAIASAVGWPDADVTLEGLAAAVGSKHMLLVLDNCEHVIDAAAGFAEALLHADARLQVIATSREPLRADGEWVYRVPSLDAPPEDQDGPDDVLRFSATKLFVERTRAADPSFQLDERVAAAASLICRRLDGIPLAIELAAARAAALGVEGLASRLNDRLSLLTDGRRTAPPRHQTLRATLDWSYELLTEAERVVMRRLAVFSGEFTLEAAIGVADIGEVSRADIVGCLAGLVAKSLVVADMGGPQSRYRLLETMRAYAMDKLAQSREFDAVAARHTSARGERSDRGVARPRAQLVGV